MIRALFWKEWRQTQVIFLFGVLVIIGLISWSLGSIERFKLYSSGGDLFADLSPVLYLLLFGVLLGAGAMSTETGNETARFLLAMPVSRQRIWSVKLAVRLLELYLLFALFSLLSHILRSVIPYDAYYDDAHFELFMFSLATLSYGLTFFSSSFLDKAVTSALMGMVLTSFFMMGGVLLLEKPFLVEERLLTPAVAALICSAISIFGSLLIFLRKEAR